MKNAPVEFKGFPKVHVIKRFNGEFEYKVYTKELTPRCNWFVKKASLFTGVSLFAISSVYSFIQVLNKIVSVEAFVVPPILGLLAWGVGYQFLGKLLTSGRSVVFTNKEIKIRKWFIFWYRSNRKHDNKFIMRPHPKAKHEKDKQELKEKSAKFTDKKHKPKKRIYAHSQIVERVSLGERVRITSPADEEKAKAYLDRFHDMEDRIPKEGHSSGAIAIDPKDDWHNQAGGLGDEL